MSMRVAIDGIPLLLRSAGVKTYLYHWIRHLQSLADDNQIVTFPYIGPLGGFSHEVSVLGRVPTLARLAFLHGVNYSRLPVLDWLGPKVDIFHPSQLLWNPPRTARLTTTVHDMTCWLMPEMHSPRNVSAARRFAERVTRKADGLIAISESSRRDAVRILGLRGEKIEVIYPGVSEAFFEVTPEIARHVAQKYQLSRPYVLFIGTIEPRKNVDMLLDAYLQLPASLKDEFELVLAGPIGWASPRTIERVHSGLPGVRYLGYVPEQDLPGLTAGTVVFVYPSFYEGFGLPVAQAMAAGVAVITSGVSSMPEVAGDATLLVDPKSPGELCAAIKRLLLSPDLRRDLRNKGIHRAQQYSWELCARKSLAFFEKICGT